MATAHPKRVDLAEAYVLHTVPFRETSLLVDAFTAEHGRLTLAARGARRPASALRGVLMPFQRVSLSWFGRGEVRTLHQAEWQSLTPGLSGRALICGFYLNELLVRLLPRDDPHPGLFEAYVEALARLPLAEPFDAVLRPFELRVLAELGYGIDLEREAGGETPVVEDGVYRYRLEHGLVPDTASTRGGREAGVEVSGASLRAMAVGDYEAESTRREARRLLRTVLGNYLGDKPLLSRELLAPFNE